MTWNAVIVDDEPLARQRLRRLLGKLAGPAIHIVAECAEVDELLRLARRARIDVLFLDIELPGGDGFTALRRWNGPPPLVVFVSAYDRHGVVESPLSAPWRAKIAGRFRFPPLT